MTDGLKPKPLNDCFAKYWRPAVLFALVAICYAASLKGEFFGDDEYIIKYNPLVLNLSYLKIFTSEHWLGAGAPVSDGLYRPLPLLTYAINYALAGMNVALFRVVNIILHGAVAIFFMRLLVRIGIGRTVAFTAALVYALHPVQAEAVCAIVGRAEIMAALFIFVGVTAGLDRKPWSMPAACGCLLGALLSKESAVAFIPLAITADYVSTSENFPALARARGKYWSMLLLTAAIWGMGRILYLPERTSLYLPEDNPIAALDFLSRLPLALKLQFTYIWKYFALGGYHYLYTAGDIPLPESLPGKASYVSMAAALVAVSTYLVIKRKPAGLAAMLYASGAAITANVFFPVAIYFGERLQYLPSAGLALLAALALAKAADLARRAGIIRVDFVHPAIVAALLIPPGISTVSRAELFSRPYALSENVIEHSPRNPRALYALSRAEEGAGKIDSAEKRLLKSLEMNPGFTETYADLSNFYYRTGRPERGLAAAQKYPGKDFLPALPALLARGHAELGDTAKALEILETMPPNVFDPNAIYASAIIAETEGDFETAIKGYRFSHIKRKTPQSATRLSRLLLRTGNYAEALDLLENTPGWWNYPDIFNQRGIANAMLGNNAEAAKWFARAAETDPTREAFRINLEKARSGAGVGQNAKQAQ